MKVDGADPEVTREVCSYCPKLCRQACPAALAEGSEQATPTFKQQVAFQAQTGERPLDPARARALYKCCDCEATVPACRHRVSVATSLRDARAGAVEQGVAPPEVEWLRQRFLVHGSPYSVDLRRRAQGGRPRPGLTGVMPACTALAHDTGSLPRVMRLLDLADVHITTALPDPPCCGYPLDAAGLDDAFRAHAQQVADALAGFPVLAVQGGACAWTMAVRYAQIGVRLAPRVRPLVDVLAEHAPRYRRLVADAALAAGQASEAPVYAYHDPCFLGRRLARVEQPREVLRAISGRAPRELGYHGRETVCTGGGGVYPLTHPDAARACGRRLGDLFRETGADVLVTGCPSAARRLKLAEPELPVQTLDEALEARLLG
ncbi:MAG: (Fe-S)-binding protein [Planctomycetota bacterium]